MVLGLWTHFFEPRPKSEPIKGIFLIQDRLENEEAYLIEVLDLSHFNHFQYQIYLPKKKDLPNLSIGTCLQISGEIQVESRIWNFSNLSIPQRPKIVVSSMKSIQYHTSYLHYIQEYIISVRTHIETYINQISSSRTRPLILALLFGDRSQLSTHLLHNFKSYGMIHLLSISGLHIFSLYQAIFFLCQKSHLPRHLSTTMTLGLILLYLWLIGIPFSGLRAFVMILMRELAGVFGREYDALTALAMSSLILQLYHSHSLYHPGVWLSLLATLALITLPKPCQKHYKSFFQILFCGLWTFPILAFLQGEIHILTILFNLFLSPLMIFCFYIAWISLGLGLLHQSIAQFSLNIVEVLILILENIFSYFDQFAYGYLLLGRRQIWGIFLYYILLILGIIYLNKEEKS